MVPPNSGVRSMTTATAIFGCSAGANAMNQALFRPATPVSAVPVLPATDQVSDVRRLSRALLHDAAHHRWSAPPPSAGTSRARPARDGCRARSCRRARPPCAPATAACARRRWRSSPTTSAICSGVASSRSWPIATRPTSSGRALRQHAVPAVEAARAPSRRSGSRAAASGRSRTRASSPPAATGRPAGRPGRTPCCTSWSGRWRSVTTPATSPPALHSGCDSTVMQVPLAVDRRVRRVLAGSPAPPSRSRS